MSTTNTYSTQTQTTSKDHALQRISTWPLHRRALKMGFIGATVVAFLFLGVNLFLGNPALTTPALLGSFLFYGEDVFTLGIQYNDLTILGYTVVHFLGFIALGYLMSMAGAAMTRKPALSAFFLLMSAIAIGPMIAATTAAGTLMSIENSGILVAGAGFAGWLAMALTLWNNAPTMRHQFKRGDWDHAKLGQHMPAA